MGARRDRCTAEIVSFNSALLNWVLRASNVEEAASGELGEYVYLATIGPTVPTYNSRNIKMPEHRRISYYGLGIMSMHESRFSGRESDASPTEVDSRTD